MTVRKCECCGSLSFIWRNGKRGGWIEWATSGKECRCGGGWIPYGLIRYEFEIEDGMILPWDERVE
jgi:hypothetical protein